MKKIVMCIVSLFMLLLGCVSCVSNSDDLIKLDELLNKRKLESISGPIEMRKLINKLDVETKFEFTYIDKYNLNVGNPNINSILVFELNGNHIPIMIEYNSIENLIKDINHEVGEENVYKNIMYTSYYFCEYILFS